jgi:hypothetical protein
MGRHPAVDRLDSASAHHDGDLAQHRPEGSRAAVVAMKPRIRFAVATDRRTHDLACRGAAVAQEAADQRLERLWRFRVEANLRRRRAKVVA